MVGVFRFKIIGFATFAIPIVPPGTLGACTYAFFKERSDLEICWKCIDASTIKIINPTTLRLGYANPIRIRKDASSYPVTPDDTFVGRCNADHKCDL